MSGEPAAGGSAAREMTDATSKGSRLLPRIVGESCAAAQGGGGDRGLRRGIEGGSAVRTFQHVAGPAATPPMSAIATRSFMVRRWLEAAVEHSKRLRPAFGPLNESEAIPGLVPRPKERRRGGVY